jgi:hypothetical protein
VRASPLLNGPCRFRERKSKQNAAGQDKQGLMKIPGRVFDRINRINRIYRMVEE